MIPADLQVARNRYHEAREILEAWRHRRDVATALAQGNPTPENVDRLHTARTRLDEAEAEHRIALKAWTRAADDNLKERR